MRELANKPRSRSGSSSQSPRPAEQPGPTIAELRAITAFQTHEPVHSVKLQGQSKLQLGGYIKRAVCQLLLTSAYYVPTSPPPSNYAPLHIIPHYFNSISPRIQYLLPIIQNGYSYGYQFHQLQWQLDYGAFHIVSLFELPAALAPSRCILTKARLTMRITGPEHLRPNGPRARYGTTPSLSFPSSPQQLS